MQQHKTQDWDFCLAKKNFKQVADFLNGEYANVLEEFEMDVV